MAKLTEVNDIYFANGFQGQYMWIIPHQNMVVVTTGGNETNPARSQSMFWEYILKAIGKP